MVGRVVGPDACGENHSVHYPNGNGDDDDDDDGDGDDNDDGEAFFFPLFFDMTNDVPCRPLATGQRTEPSVSSPPTSLWVGENNSTWYGK